MLLSMKICGIISEYNPFHNGHKYQIEQTLKAGATHIIAVLSGHFVQRGDISIFSKWTRAKAALLNGVDLVIELPCVFSCSSAENFATGGVHILNSLGCVDNISFGSESGNIKELKAAALACADIDSSIQIRQYLKEGLSYPKARNHAVKDIYGEDVSLSLESPNNILGIEYLKAIGKLNSPIKPITIARKSAPHDARLTEGNISSASYLRELIHLSDLKEIKNFVPKTAYDVYVTDIDSCKGPASIKEIETGILLRLKTATKEQFKVLPDVTEGLENRLVSCAKKATSLEGFYHLVKTKRYTMSRIRRIVFCLVLGITKQDISNLPTYARVIGCNKKGMEILNIARKTSAIQLTPDFAKISRNHPRQAEIDSTATDVFNMALPKIQQGGSDYYNNCIIIK